MAQGAGARRAELHAAQEPSRASGISTRSARKRTARTSASAGKKRTATFMILGDVCTRNCGYCAIAHGKPVWEDREEPERIGRRRRRSEPRLRRDHVGEPRRPGRRRRRALGGHGSRRPAARAAVSRRGADSRFPGQHRVARDGHRGRPGHLEPQHRDGAASLQGRPARRALRADARAVPPCPRRVAPTRAAEVRDHPGPRRDARTSSSPRCATCARSASRS